MSKLTDDYRRTLINRPPKILEGADAFCYAFTGRRKSAMGAAEKFLQRAKAIDEQSGFWQGLSDEALHQWLRDLKQVFRRRKQGYEEYLTQAFGAVREASARCLGLRPFVVQIAGALAMYEGNIVEMATGEGKTLTAGLAAVVQGWSGLPCHIITVNDYLASRDAQWLLPLYKFCGVTVGYVTGEMTHDARRQGYDHEVVYTTSKEIVADFLRDRLSLGDMQQLARRRIRTIWGGQSTQSLVMRGIHTAIVDEADSILIDEAVTPLIISRHQDNEVFVKVCKAASQIAAGLKRDIDYRLNQQYKEVELTDSFHDHIAHHLQTMPDKWLGLAGRTELIEQALTAKEFFHRDNQYIVKEGKIVIVDEFTGRQMPQRSWRAGLHQLVEAKENLEITAPTETLARLSFQRFFRFFYKLSGMTGTARESAPELWQIYRLPVISIPENKPCCRQVCLSRIFITQEEKYKAIIHDVVEMHALGRPVLLGTRSVETSEMLSTRLTELGLPHRVLNAVRHQEEARIVSHAGEPGAITIATNMAGRGTDIVLGPGVAAVGGLHVIASECHESRRIDRQLFGRCARQGDPGSACAFISMEDELLRRNLPIWARNFIIDSLEKQAKYAYKLAIKAIEYTQNNAQGLAFRRRKGVLRTDTWLDDSLSFAHGDVAE